jgi:hypothetical protein
MKIYQADKNISHKVYPWGPNGPLMYWLGLICRVSLLNFWNADHRLGIYSSWMSSVNVENVLWLMIVITWNVELSNLNAVLWNVIFIPFTLLFDIITHLIHIDSSYLEHVYKKNFIIFIFKHCYLHVTHILYIIFLSSWVFKNSFYQIALFPHHPHWFNHTMYIVLSKVTRLVQNHAWIYVVGEV